MRIKTSAGGPNDANALAPRLIQEFVRVRREDEKEAMLTALVVRNFNKRSIVFFETKKAAHRFYIILKLLNIKVCELHGDMPQTLRYGSLQAFRAGQTDVMVATDVAARGLDIPLVQTVLNAEMPRVASTYVHRVGEQAQDADSSITSSYSFLMLGRTARAGCGGRAITIVSDSRRKVMKEVLKSEAMAPSTGKQKEGANGAIDDNNEAMVGVFNRTIPLGVVAHYVSLLAGMEAEVTELMLNDDVTKKALEAEREAERAENMLLHDAEITSRPARTWYQTEAQKQSIREAAKAQSELETEAAKVGFEVASATEKARIMAMQDDYQQDETDRQKKKEHKMTRKKRRRIEALRAMEEGTGDLPCCIVVIVFSLNFVVILK